ncbi:MAG: TIGR00282 family metallophosphoesterase [Candidatus Omnitrophica bacterium CG11_big_fil_rev_8_21_14_0_20_64_10]|nr:MAG: TIGR00282 family metallophosphoesterase [Candidatus Omnitrophica bacterium CG11_big_fil_rev_8_21_14_0_20_64_10]
MKILMVGDVVGAPGRDAVKAIVPILKARLGLDFVVVNAENIAGGAGVTPKTANELLSAGADMLTSGQHIWRQKEILSYIAAEPRLLKPANYPAGTPGIGAHCYKSRAGDAVGVINLLGRVFMGVDALDDPFRKADQLIEELKQKTKVILVDFHAEATSEKIVMGWYLDGRVSAVVGTHTHVQTADERILPKGTAYLTDLGMTGPHDSVIGREIKPVLEKFLTGMPNKFDVAEGNVWLCGALIEVDERTGKAVSIVRVREKFGV